MKIRPIHLAPLLLVACQVAEETPELPTIRYLVAQGDFTVAIAQARTAWEATPEDSAATKDYRFATVAFLLERGRTATFDDRDEDALADFEEAMALQPDAIQTAQWVAKTRRKLSGSWFVIARDQHASEQLFLAADAYEKALDYDPSNLDALEGLHRVGVQLGYRDGLSADYYNEGLSALRETDLHIAGSRFDYAGKYAQGDERPAKRRAEVDEALADRFAVLALELEEQGFYAAAKADFRVSLSLDGENQTSQEGYERMQIEADAHELFKRGEMWIRRGGFDQAVSVLHEGREMTSVQQDRFDELLGEIDDLRTAAQYEQALNYEHDFQFENAAGTYRELLDERGFYEDARARLTRMEQVIEEVEALYAGLDQLSGKGLLAALEQIDVLWPEYRDVQEQMDAFEGK